MIHLRLLAPVSLLSAAVLALLAGCTSPGLTDPARVGPFHTPTNVARDATLGGIRRVVMLPVWTGTSAPEETGADLDPVFRQALQDQNRFEVVVLPRAECLRRFGAVALSSSSALPHDFLPAMQRIFGADAVVFVDITVYRPYHPLAIGVRSRLATVKSTRLVWTFDNLFSADDARVAASARNFFLQSEHGGVPGDLTPSVLQSPSRFAAYAAAATFATLPPVTVESGEEAPPGRR
ncbi:hypothetical protein [Opitutus sp. ER46]|uniref:hypothetical protein n=1 Tax=Opitutus sp. ER46 TaxID=2161864 RepID=UPI000D31D4FA|nr:hypothetical protein [Opitutus sp. ER46]PTX90878.1 hypothetical protein DB354_19700 [Opitutus sp. ER46]